jgi:predicted RNA-binding protein YlqC (UPF0109 family)
MAAMKELVEYVVQSIVDEPAAVSVTEVDTGATTTLELSVADGDMGRVIGKGGRVINSIRTVMQILAAKQGKEASLELLENDRH